MKGLLSAAFPIARQARLREIIPPRGCRERLTTLKRSTSVRIELSFVELNVQEAAAEVCAEVGVRNAQLVTPVCSVAVRNDVVKDPVISRGKLVDLVAGEDVGFRQSEVASSIG